MPPRIITARSMKLEFKPMTGMGPENSVVGHYSGGSRAKDFKEGIRKAKEFHRDHQKNRGWAGIGYHFLIPDDGSIICCRSTFFNGAHVLNSNSGRIGVNMPATLLFEGEEGGPVRDRPTRRQAMAFDWLLNNAHTDAMPRRHRTTRDLSELPIFVHKELLATRCPGLFKRMYKRGGIRWVEPTGDEPLDGGILDLTAEDEQEDEELLAEFTEGRAPSPYADAEVTGPDEEELLLIESDVDETLELPEADEEFDEDLDDILAEIEAEERQPTG